MTKKGNLSLCQRTSLFRQSLKAALVLLGACTVASAASATESNGFEISGIVDLGVQVQHVGGKTATTMESGNNKSSSIDLRWKETIGEDLYVNAYLSNWFTADDGQLGEDDRLFDEASLTLGSRTWGEFLMGRIGSLKCPDGDQSIFARAEGFSPMGSNLPHTGLPYVFLNGGVLNNAWGWNSPIVNGHQILLQYSDGVETDTTGKDEDTQGSIGFVYNNDGNLRYGVIFTVRTHGSEAERHRATKDVMASVNYDFDAWRLYVTYQHVEDGIGSGTMMRWGRFSGFKASEKGFRTDALLLGLSTGLAGGRLSAVIQGSYSSFEGDTEEGVKTDGWRLNPAAIWRYPLSHRTTAWTAASWTHGWGMYKQVTADASRPDNPNCWTLGVGITHTF